MFLPILFARPNLVIYKTGHYPSQSVSSQQIIRTTFRTESSEGDTQST